MLVLIYEKVIIFFVYCIFSGRSLYEYLWSICHVSVLGCLLAEVLRKQQIFLWFISHYYNNAITGAHNDVRSGRERLSLLTSLCAPGNKQCSSGIFL